MTYRLLTYGAELVATGQQVMPNGRGWDAYVDWLRSGGSPQPILVRAPAPSEPPPPAVAAMNCANVRNFGAVGDGVADDTAAVQAAIDTVQPVYFPPGRYSITAVTLAGINSQRLFGAGYGDRDTFIVARDATSTVITVNAGQVLIDHLQFIPSVPRTAGAYVSMQQADCTLTDFRMTGAFIGVIMNATNCRVRFGEITNTVVAGIGIRVDAGFNLTVLKVDIGGSPNCAAAISVLSTADLQIIACQLLNATVGLKISPSGSGTASSVILNDTFCDSCTYGLYVEPTGGGNVVRFRATACWFNGSIYGAFISKSLTAGVVKGFQFTGCQFLGATNDGLLFNANDLEVNGGHFAQNTGSGISLQAGADEVVVNNTSIGAVGDLAANGQGIVVVAGCVNYLITGNKIRGNMTAQINDGGGAVNKLVANNLVT